MEIPALIRYNDEINCFEMFGKSSGVIRSGFEKRRIVRIYLEMFDGPA